MRDSQQFVGGRAMLGLGVAVLAAGLSRRSSAASRMALDALAARLVAAGEDGLDPRHHDLWDAALARAIPVRLHYDTVMVEGKSVVMRRDISALMPPISARWMRRAAKGWQRHRPGLEAVRQE